MVFYGSQKANTARNCVTPCAVGHTGAVRYSTVMVQ
jgi:hypothetical protein